MDPKQFRMFTQEAEFMPNNKLLNANFLKGGRRRTIRLDQIEDKIKIDILNK